MLHICKELKLASIYICLFVAQTLINCLLRKYFTFDLLCELFGHGFIPSFRQCPTSC